MNPPSAVTRPPSKEKAPPSLSPPPKGAAAIRSTAPSSSRPAYCAVDVNEDGSGDAIVRIDPDILLRIQRRAGSHDLADYLWNNVFKQALMSHVY